MLYNTRMAHPDPYDRSLRMMVSMLRSRSVARSSTCPMDGDEATLPPPCGAELLETEDAVEDAEMRLRMREVRFSSCDFLCVLLSVVRSGCKLSVGLRGVSGMADSPEDAVLIAISDGRDEGIEPEDEELDDTNFMLVLARDGIDGRSTSRNPSPLEVLALSTGELVRLACFCCTQIATDGGDCPPGSVFDLFFRTNTAPYLGLVPFALGRTIGLASASELGGLGASGAMRSDTEFCSSNRPSSMLSIVESIEKPRCGSGGVPP